MLKVLKIQKNVHLCINAVEYYDQKTDLTAMEKWTGWHISILAIQIADNKVDKRSNFSRKCLERSHILEEAKKKL